MQAAFYAFGTKPKYPADFRQKQIGRKPVAVGAEISTLSPLPSRSSFVPERARDLLRPLDVIAMQVNRGRRDRGVT